MITKRKYFELKGRCIIEKMVIENSARITVEFPNEACYLYVREGELVVNSNLGSCRMMSSDGVVLSCGNYIADFIKRSPGYSTEVFAVHLYPELLREIFRNEIPSFLKSEEFKKPAMPIRNEVMDRFIDSLLFYFDNPNIVTEEILTLKIRELILLLVQSDHAETVQLLFANLFTRNSVSIAEVVKTHLYNNLSIEELAKLSGVSASSFKVEFAKLFNESPGKYLKKKRLQRATELLIASDDSISEIAYQTGYHDISHFSKAFESSYKCSPGTYRQRIRADANT